MFDQSSLFLFICAYRNIVVSNKRFNIKKNIHLSYDGCFINK